MLAGIPGTKRRDTISQLFAMSATLLDKNSDMRTKHFTRTLTWSVRQTRDGPRKIYQIDVNVIFVNLIFQNNYFFLCAGRYCLDPPIPDDEYNLILDTTYDKDSPREINEVITYYCHTKPVEGTAHWNRRLDNFANSYSLRCQEKNTWDTPSWPTCAPSMSKVSSLYHI